jgi:AraC-like DNA-binding protein
MTDALLDIIGGMNLTGGIFLDAELTAPWCITAKVGPEDCSPHVPPPHHIIGYHYVSAGRVLLQVEGQPPAEAVTGDIIVLPRNDEHTLGSAAGVRPVCADGLIQPSPDGGLPRIVHGGGGEATRILCGFLGGDRQCEAVTGFLPPVLILNVAGGASGTWIESSLKFAADQLSSGSAQSTAVVAKLAGLLFLEAVRRHLTSLPAEQSEWTAGLGDAVVGRALALLHRRPDRRWTTEDLAREVGLSRSALGQRFTRLMGEPPMRYLASLRLQAAARRLATSHDAISRIAFESGYESEAAFNRAFKRELGMAPAAWRRQQAMAARAG